MATGNVHMPMLGVNSFEQTAPYKPPVSKWWRELTIPWALANKGLILPLTDHADVSSGLHLSRY